jgi:hypothetical protein
VETRSKTLTVRRSVTWAITLTKLSAIVLLIVLLNMGVSWLIDRLDIQIWPQYLEIVDRAVLIAVILYIGLMATPFLPGIEVGLALMMMLGPKGVLVTYVCTLIALTISFGLGRLFPTHLLVSLLRWLNLTRAEALLESFCATPPEKRLDFLAEKAPAQTVPALLKRRYLLLALLLNLPGNALIGGGGGIGMMAGISRLYSFPKYVFLVSVAILPGPTLVMLSKFFP